MDYSYNEANRVLSETVPLVTRAEVLLICKEIDEDTPVDETTSFIGTAHAFLYDQLDGYGITLALMKQIELYLSAHFATLTYSTVSRRGMGPMAESFALKVDLGFNATRYGQMAMSIDPTGRLADPRKKQVRMLSLGSGVVV